MTWEEATAAHAVAAHVINRITQEESTMRRTECIKSFALGTEDVIVPAAVSLRGLRVRKVEGGRADWRDLGGTLLLEIDGAVVGEYGLDSIESDGWLVMSAGTVEVKRELRLGVIYESDTPPLPTVTVDVVYKKQVDIDAPSKPQMPAILPAAPAEPPAARVSPASTVDFWSMDKDAESLTHKTLVEALVTYLEENSYSFGPLTFYGYRRNAVTDETLEHHALFAVECLVDSLNDDEDLGDLAENHQVLRAESYGLLTAAILEALKAERAKGAIKPWPCHRVGKVVLSAQQVADFVLGGVLGGLPDVLEEDTD